MAAAMRMPKDVETRIRALPGNDMCADCTNLNPQWASVTYGTLVCLECSGHHRSLGVHLSFVRSVEMDSWKQRQIDAMEKSGGNAALVNFFKERNIPKTMGIAAKYNTKQAAFYKDRLTRIIDGQPAPPGDPGRYDPATAGPPPDAQGSEPLPGETTEQYNARQARLREEARERMRQKFGNGGMGTGNFGSSPMQQDDGWGGIGGIGGKAVGAVGGVVGGVGGFLKNNVVENENLQDSLRSGVGKLGGYAGGLINSVRATVQEGQVVDSLKRNATLQDGSALSRGLNWGAGAVSTLASKTQEKYNDFSKGGDCSIDGHSLIVEPYGDMQCAICNARGTRYTCSRGCGHNVCPKCFDKPAASMAPNANPMARTSSAPGGSTNMQRTTSGQRMSNASSGWDDDDWGDMAPPPAPSQSDMARMAREMGMNTSAVPKTTPAPAAPSPKAATEVKRDSSANVAEIQAIKNIDLSSPAKPPSAKKAPVQLQKSEDFFADFGM
eukprot:gnl/MRDRNA2_/MRDRNA2_68144_c0_seq2.p1 gnl/MRDRNA2_/MRDRNA2_68144_c0~~gnl/MRDRNA2_/MRDRNA2_68144_c0_seq2.p1  ORF type:complete len:496 (-),score=96.60 gnl/MRDRNA2_/MRDRNA2_68144_c0_seq2:41-1528(-)